LAGVAKTRAIRAHRPATTDTLMHTVSSSHIPKGITAESLSSRTTPKIPLNARASATAIARPASSVPRLIPLLDLLDTAIRLLEPPARAAAGILGAALEASKEKN